MFYDVVSVEESWEQWMARRSAVRDRIGKTMGEEPFPEWRVTGRFVQNRILLGCSARDFTLEILPGYQCAGTLVLPEVFLPGHPLVFCIHGTTSLGRRNVLDPETCPNRCYGIELAQRGFATCSLDLFGFGEWEVRGRKSAELQKEFYRDFPNWSLDGVQVRLHRMAIDWLTTLPDYCFGTFGAIGNSLGGRVSVYLAAFEERLTAAVVSCGISPNLTNVYRNYPGGAQPELSPRLNAAMVSCGKPPWEYQELLALAAPRALCVVEPFNDPYNPLPFAGMECFDRARRLWELAGVPERTAILYHGMGHDVPPAIRHFAYEFLEAHLVSSRERKETAFRK